MYMTNYDPFYNVARQMFRMPSLFAADEKEFPAPAVDIREDEKGWTFLVELPGVKVPDIDVHVEENELVVNAARKSASEQRKEDGKYVHIERTEGSYQRRFPLPATRPRNGFGEEQGRRPEHCRGKKRGSPARENYG